MSYILDALNKSEKERARKKLPGINRVDTSEDQAGLGLKHWVVIVLVILVLNTIGLYVMFGDRLQTSPSPVSTQQPPEAAPSTVATPSDSTTLQSAETAPVPLHRQTQPQSSLPTRILLPTVPVAELPASVRNQLPELEISTHIYASDPALRMVKVNGVDRKEGDFVAPLTQLIEVTESGVVLAWQQHQYAINVVEDWQL